MITVGLSGLRYNSGDGTASRKWPPRTQNQALRLQPFINPVAEDTAAPAIPARRMEYNTILSGAKVDYN